ncbi:hypothetical protein [Brevundimonas sp.]|uniref:hypothetical protein n=1 Tax=Brevundimonas sp. TaxID=1871086 RepID=UPI0028ADE07C|nr:hypothetical protein [Brevundimonas sp.]
MSIITGVQTEAFADFAEDFEDGVLIVPGAQVSDGQGGFVTGSPTSHDCKALVTDYDDFRRASLGIPGTDRLVLVLGGSLPTGVIPAKGHKITAPDPAKGLAPSTFDVIAKTGDPAAALYELQAR